MRTFWFAFALCALGVNASFNILDFGAVPNENTIEAALANAKAITLALQAANASSFAPSDICVGCSTEQLSLSARQAPCSAAELVEASLFRSFPQLVPPSRCRLASAARTALVPSNYTFYIGLIEVDYLTSVTLQIDGHLIFNNNYTYWQSLNPDLEAVFYVLDATGFTITGSGVIEGQGYDWWWQVLLTGKDNRPHLLTLKRSQSVLIEGVSWRNSPQYHLNMEDNRAVTVQHLTIWVDVEQQSHMLKQTGNFDSEKGIPTFPLNTDGMDPAISDAIIQNVTIQSFDDIVAVKPCNQNHKMCTCSENMLIQQVNAYWGLGATIGSVPPNVGINCVRNITFLDWKFTNAIKSIYIKTNPGSEGSGVIDSITYRNLYSDRSWWYPIWIGPQQQQQPGHGANTGCSFFFPLNTTCSTQPRVPITNVLLSNVTLNSGLFLPGVILCNSTRVCQNIVFENVINTGSFIVQKSYYCANAEVIVKGDSSPSVNCINTRTVAPLSSSSSSPSLVDLVATASSSIDPDIDLRNFEEGHFDDESESDQ